jgi:hypothetical protein
MLMEAPPTLSRRVFDFKQFAIEPFEFSRDFLLFALRPLAVAAMGNAGAVAGRTEHKRWEPRRPADGDALFAIATTSFAPHHPSAFISAIVCGPAMPSTAR